MNRYAWTFVAYIAFCFLAPFYMLSRGPITPDRLALLWAMVAALGAFVNLWLAYGAGRWILRKLRRSRP
jgi:membrane protein DedA with SNARE-associated domain